jgi:carboxymethylenebutenolidase
MQAFAPIRSSWLPAALAIVLAACGSSEPPPEAGARVAAVGAAEAEPEPELGAEPADGAEASASAPVLEQALAYGEGKNSNLEGFLAMPGDAAEPLPAVIVIHDWWGLNGEIKSIARRLAGEGYVVLAVDLFGGATADTTERAQALMAESFEDSDAVRRNLHQAYDYLEKYALAPRIGAIGWSFGGGWALQTALMYPHDLDAMVMYYGPVETDSRVLETLNTPMLGFFGAEDASIPIQRVQDFRGKLIAEGKQAEILIVPQAGHAFASPSSGTYDEGAAADAWNDTLAFFERNLKVDSGR